MNYERKYRYPYHYPKDRKRILYDAVEGNDETRRVAWDLLPYSEEKAFCRKIAIKNARIKDLYRIDYYALNRLSYPEDRDILLKILRITKNGMYLKRVLEKLPYREERSIIQKIILKVFINPNSINDFCFFESFAESLPYSEVRDLFIKIAHLSKNWQSLSFVAKKLPYPEEKETLRELALNGLSAATEKLPYPEERETLRKAALSGSVHAIKRLHYPEDEDVYIQIINSCREPYILGEALTHYQKNSELVYKVSKRLSVKQIKLLPNTIRKMEPFHKKEGHHFQDGFCIVCGKKCDHVWVIETEDMGAYDYDSAGRPVESLVVTYEVCRICGLKVAQSYSGPYNGPIAPF